MALDLASMRTGDRLILPDGRLLRRTAASFEISAEPGEENTVAADTKSPTLTVEERRNLRKTQFALPAARAYPIDTPGRARNALARVAQNGTPDEKQQVAQAVAKKYPALKNSPFVRAQRLLAARKK